MSVRPVSQIDQVPGTYLPLFGTDAAGAVGMQWRAFGVPTQSGHIPVWWLPNPAGISLPLRIDGVVEVGQ